MASDGSARLARAGDTDKDQTYFLYGLRQDQLEHARFPLGELTKPEVRAIARELGLVTADKPESQEICFVPGGDYREALRERAGWRETPGPIIDADGGEQVGEHRGAAAYTVGQRQGLGVALGTPRYVSRIDPLTNTIQLGRREDLETREFAVERVTFVSRRSAGRRRRQLPSGRPDPPSRRPHPGNGAAGDRRRAIPRRSLDRRDRRAGLGRGAGPGARSSTTATSSSAAAGSAAQTLRRDRTRRTRANSPELRASA